MKLERWSWLSAQMEIAQSVSILTVQKLSLPRHPRTQNSLLLAIFEIETHVTSGRCVMCLSVTAIGPICSLHLLFCWGQSGGVNIKLKGQVNSKIKEVVFPLMICVSVFLPFLPPPESRCWWDNNPQSASANYPKSVIIIIFSLQYQKNVRKTNLKAKKREREINYSSRTASAWTILIHVGIRNILLSTETLLLCDYIFNISFFS